MKLNKSFYSGNFNDNIALEAFEFGKNAKDLNIERLMNEYLDGDSYRSCILHKILIGNLFEEYALTKAIDISKRKPSAFYILFRSREDIEKALYIIDNYPNGAYFFNACLKELFNMYCDVLHNGYYIRNTSSFKSLNFMKSVLTSVLSNKNTYFNEVQNWDFEFGDNSRDIDDYRNVMLRVLNDYYVYLHDIYKNRYNDNHFMNILNTAYINKKADYDMEVFKRDLNKAVAFPEYISGHLMYFTESLYQGIILHNNIEIYKKLILSVIEVLCKYESKMKVYMITNFIISLLGNLNNKRNNEKVIELMQYLEDTYRHLNIPHVEDSVYKIDEFFEDGIYVDKVATIEANYEISLLEEEYALEAASKQKSSKESLANKVAHAWKIFSENTKRVEDKVNKTANAIWTAIMGTDPDKMNKIVVEGKQRTLTGTIKAVLAGSAVFSYSAMLFFMGMLVRATKQGKVKKQTKRKIQMTLESELEIINEKIDDARGENNKQAKYALIRSKKVIENALKRIKYNIGAEVDDNELNDALNTSRTIERSRK